MNIRIKNINWLAVGVAAFAIMMIGGIWYQALFGDLWMQLHAYSETDIKRMQERMPPHLFFPIMFGSYVVVSIGLALLLSSLESSDIRKGLAIGAVAWLVVAAIGMTGYITSETHIGIYAIDTSFQLVIFLAAGAILGAWR